MTSAKPYRIAKRTVWEAFQQVKANRGAAGIDDESIAMLEQDLSKNLYKLWNRMSSGSYMPPPVRQARSRGSGPKNGHELGMMAQSSSVCREGTAEANTTLAG